MLELAGWVNAAAGGDGDASAISALQSPDMALGARKEAAAAAVGAAASPWLAALALDIGGRGTKGEAKPEAPICSCTWPARLLDCIVCCGEKAPHGSVSHRKKGASAFLTFCLTCLCLSGFEGQERFARWGGHYNRALLRAHQLQICTNFMDPGLQVHGACHRHFQLRGGVPSCVHGKGR